ncbi:MAG: GMP/IMP nucleotidase [Gammaproteobacteria bacterium]|nr:GMP/IMP nucleotidase [Gammaproteobacteria bacterium]MDH5654083.1 GMP/IMP nucleotidase [Gammaproteobacteria bacterium]
MINWNNIDTVLLDMDGTLLDLYFDSYFWREHVPLRYAEKHDLHVEAAKTELFPKLQAVEGTMNWYCVDYWSETLGLDIALLKAEINHLIAIHPHVLDFLTKIRSINKKAVLVTNAHQKSLMLKLDRTQLHDHLDQIICSHDYGMPKEETDFWQQLHNDVDYQPQHTLLVDDSLPVLRSAKRYGIAHLLCVHKPDSQGPNKDVEEFEAIHSFRDIMP